MQGANLIEWVGVGASIATCIVVVLMGWSIWIHKQALETQFEDALSREYRDIVRNLPVKALLGHELTYDEYQDALKTFYQYIDLGNGQVFLRHKNRVRESTWQDWCAGIRYNLSQPAFKKAWTEIKKEADGSFRELRCLEKSNFKKDPLKMRFPCALID